ncbi:MAG: VWA domain-containing protein [Desulfovibrio sp.]|nr:VWA domain-containing protein [Desulfovibrio sp.]
MCLMYTHPENRKPVLMFANEDTLAGLIAESPDKRAEQAKNYYDVINSGTIPADFPIVSVEPQNAVDYSRQFYLMPILDFAATQIDGREGRILQLAAVGGSGAEAREKTDIRQNSTYTAQATVTPAKAAAAPQVAKKLQFDVVWVIDTTRSMGPYIESTKDVVRSASMKLASEPAVGENVRFGLWAYRDSLEAMPKIGYTTMNYTEELQPVDQFLKAVADVKDTKTDSLDFPEDVFSGLSDAVTKTAWTPGAVRLVILVGDAPGHKLGHKWNLSGYDETTARALATEHNITLIAVQIRPNEAKNHQKVAERQFSVLASNPGTTETAYFSIPGDKIKHFSTSIEKALATTISVLEAAANDTLGAVLEEDALPVRNFSDDLPVQSAPDISADTAKSDIGLGQALRAAVVRWIGSKTEAKAPRDIVAWVTDKDLVNTARASLEVHLLVTKRQLDSLASLLSDITKAGRTGQISGDDFFTSLQAVSAVASRDPDRLKNAASLADSGLIPAFLQGLPYNSMVMTLTNEMWNSWGSDEQDNFLNALDARIVAYRAIHDNPEGWVPLNEGADADESVHPVPLELLP